MKQLIVRCIVLVLITLAWSVPALTEPPPAPRGEVRIVDKRPASKQSIVDNRLEALVRYAEDGKFLPSLARSWRWLDPRTLEMQLRQGATFHNGEVFDAQIVKLNVAFWQEHRRYWENIPTDPMSLWWDFPLETRLDILDPYTIRFVLSAPDAEFLNKLRQMRIANRQLYQAVDKLAQERNRSRALVYWWVVRGPGPWGTGPYIQLEGESPTRTLENRPQARRQTKQVVLEANHAYWDRTRFPQVQRIVFDNGLALGEAVELVKTQEGHVDLVADVRTIDTLRVAQSPFGKVVKERKYLRSMHGFFNTRKADSPWRDVRLRQAVNYAINRAHFMRYAAKGNGVLVPALLAPVAFGYDRTLAPYPFDPHKARLRLRQAGYADGLEITLLSLEPSHVQATVIGKMLEQVGFTVQVQIVDNRAWFKQTNDFWFKAPHRQHLNLPWPTWDIALMSKLSRYPHDAYHLPFHDYRAYALLGPWNWITVQPELRQLYAQAMSTRDQARQQAVLHQMERHTRDQAYFLFLYSPIQLYAVNQAVNFRAIAGSMALVDLSVTDQHWSVRKEKVAGQK